MPGTPQPSATDANAAGARTLARAAAQTAPDAARKHGTPFARVLRLIAGDRLLALNLAFFAALWLLLFNRLHTEWMVNELYAYGWAVPFLALFLFLERWRDRPPAAAARPSAWWLVPPAALVLAYAPVRLINEANPDWVKINFLMTTLVAGVSLCALFAMGRLRYVWHFAFPLLFVYTALPWPVMVEENLVQGLTRLNTNLSAETLTLAGLPALATGNVIQIGDAMVNVAEACSGIRSLQTAFMMSLFLGEFHRLGWLARALLMLSSFAVAFALNIGRTMTLTVINSRHGAETMERWHDPVGYAVMIGCLAGLWLLAVGFSKIKTKYATPSRLSALTIGAKPKTPSPQTPPAPAPLLQPFSPSALQPFPYAFLIFGFATLLVAEAGTEIWYRSHEKQLAPPPAWQIDWPQNAPNFRESVFPDRTRAILKYNEGRTASWTTPGGIGVQMYCIRWLPGRVSKFLSGAHYPTVCLPASGLAFKREAGVFAYRAGPVDIRFATFLFESRDRPVYVFHAIVEDRPAPDGEQIDYRQVKGGERIDSVLRGHRNLGQRVLGISIYNAPSLDDAETALRASLDQILTITPGG